MKKTRGFSLMELMVTVVVAAILVSIAVPLYQDYIRRGQVQEAPGNLAQWRLLMEQFYQDNRTYADASGNCGAAAPSGNVAYFTYSCATANSGQNFTATATGSAALTKGLSYTINDQNVRATTCASCAWSPLPSSAANTWIVKRP